MEVEVALDAAQQQATELAGRSFNLDSPKQLQALLYNAPSRPVILGKRDANGAPLLSEVGELRPSRVLPVLAAWLALWTVTWAAVAGPIREDAPVERASAVVRSAS